MIYVMTYGGGTKQGLSFKTYGEMSAYCKRIEISPTKLYNTGRKLSDPRHVAYVESDGMMLVRVAKKNWHADCRAQGADATEETGVTYESIQNSGAANNDRGCCSVIACAIAANVSFDKAQKAMARAGRKLNHGVSVMQIKRGMEFLGKNMKLDIPSIEKVQGKTINQATRLLGEGTFMVIVRGHVACVKNGVCEDWTAGRRHKVQTVYKVEA